jgi:hypothetical protein
LHPALSQILLLLPLHLPLLQPLLLLLLLHPLFLHPSLHPLLVLHWLVAQISNPQQQIQDLLQLPEQLPLVWLLLLPPSRMLLLVLSKMQILELVVPGLPPRAQEATGAKQE